MRQHQLKKLHGFTLIELLVVISIILIASSIIFIGGRGGSGASLGAGQRVVSSIAQGARGQAILKNARTRLIIHDDVNEPDKFRRFFGIIYEDSENPNQWFAATQGTYLPDGVYFDRSGSISQSAGTWAGSRMSLEFPRRTSQAPGGGSRFTYYEFNSNGTLPTSDANSWLVIRTATMIPTGNGSAVSSLTIDEDSTNLKSALIIRRTGTTTSVNEPAAIDRVSDGSIPL